MRFHPSTVFASPFRGPRCRKLFAAIGFTLPFALGTAAPAQWTGFQNSGRPIVAADDLPVDWSPEQHVAWTADVEGYGQSSPVIARGLVVVTSTSGDNKDRCHISAFVLASGKPKWTLTRDNPSPFENTPMVSRAAPSPIATDDGFIAAFEGGLVVAVDDSGSPKWELNLVERYGAIEARHGLAASLEQNDRFVFVWVERQTDPYVLAIDKHSGEVIWKSAGVGATSWASPRLVSVAGDDHLVCSASGTIIGLDTQTGQPLWRLDGLANNTSCTPVPAGEGSFLVGASDGRGEATPTGAANANGLVKVTRSPDRNYQAEYVWRADKATCSFGSPVAVGDQAWFVNRAGVLYRLDLKTGERLGTERLESGSLWATPLITKETAYLFGYKGTTSVLNPDSGREIATNRLWKESGDGSPFGGRGPVLYAAAATAETLILRTGDRLYALRK